MAATITFKRGTTFACNSTYTPGAGPTTLAGVTVVSDIIDAGNGIYPLAVVVAGDNLSFTMTAETPSGGWALGNARWDIKFSIDGVVFYSETLRINIIERVTA